MADQRKVKKVTNQVLCWISLQGIRILYFVNQKARKLKTQSIQNPESRDSLYLKV